MNKFEQKTLTVKWLVERKPTGKVIGNWQVVAHPSNYRTGLETITYLQEEEKDKRCRYKGRFRIVREEREILHDTGEIDG